MAASREHRGQIFCLSAKMLPSQRGQRRSFSIGLILPFFRQLWLLLAFEDTLDNCDQVLTVIGHCLSPEAANLRLRYVELAQCPCAYSQDDKRVLFHVY